MSQDPPVPPEADDPTPGQPRASSQEPLPPPPPQWREAPPPGSPPPSPAPGWQGSPQGQWQGAPTAAQWQGYYAAGQAALPTRFVIEDTTWTFPLMIATCCYFVFSALNSLYSVFGDPSIKQAYVNSFMQSFQQQAANSAAQGAATPSTQQAFDLANGTWGFFIAIFVFWAAVKIGLGLAGLKAWRWVWIVEMIFLSLGSLAGLISEVAFLGAAVTGQVTATRIFAFILAIAAQALLVWMIVASTRFGMWAVVRRPIVEPAMPY
jgi:hypothetical protein